MTTSLLPSPKSQKKSRESPSGSLLPAALNVTVVDPVEAGYLVAYPCGERPLASNLNFVAGQTVATMALAPVSADGRVCIAASAPAHVVVDVSGTVLG